METRWQVLLHQLWCLPFVTQDLAIKLLSLWRRAFTHQRLTPLPIRRPGAEEILYLWPGFNMCSAEFEPFARRLAELLNSDIEFMDTRPGCGNVEPVLLGVQRNEAKLKRVSVSGQKIVHIGHSMGGLDALFAAKYCIDQGAPPADVEVHCLFSPIRGSQQAWFLRKLLFILRFLMGPIPYELLVRTAEDMIPGSQMQQECRATILELRRAGVKIYFYYGTTDALVSRLQASHGDDEEGVIHLSFRGHCLFLYRSNIPRITHEIHVRRRQETP